MVMVVVVEAYRCHVLCVPSVFAMIRWLVDGSLQATFLYPWLLHHMCTTRLLRRVLFFGAMLGVVQASLVESVSGAVFLVVCGCAVPLFLLQTLCLAVASEAAASVGISSGHVIGLMVSLFNGGAALAMVAAPHLYERSSSYVYAFSAVAAFLGLSLVERSPASAVGSFESVDTNDGELDGVSSRKRSRCCSARLLFGYGGALTSIVCILALALRAPSRCAGYSAVYREWCLLHYDVSPRRKHALEATLDSCAWEEHPLVLAAWSGPHYKEYAAVPLPRQHWCSAGDWYAVRARATVRKQSGRIHQHGLTRAPAPRRQRLLAPLLVFRRQP